MKEIALIGSRNSAGKESLLSAFLSAMPGAVIADCSLEYNALIKVMQPFDVFEKPLPFFRGFSFDSERCTRCGMCLGICLQGALELVDDQMRFYEYRCTHCSSCVKWCPMMNLSHDEHSEVYLYSAMTRFGPLIYSHSFMEPSLQPEMIHAIRAYARDMARDTQHDFLLINGSRGLRNTSLAATENVDALVAVLSPSPHALDDLKRIIRFSRKVGQEPLVVLNMIDINAEQSIQMEEICNEMKINLIGKIQYNEEFREALLRNKTIAEINPESDLVRNILEIWQKVLDHTVLIN